MFRAEQRYDGRLIVVTCDICEWIVATTHPYMMVFMTDLHKSKCGTKSAKTEAA